MRKLLSAAIVVLALAGCSQPLATSPASTAPTSASTHTTASPGASGSTTPGTSAPGSSQSASGSASPGGKVVSASATPTASSTVVIPAGACLPATDPVMAWVRNLTTNDAYPVDDVVMVAAGDGNRPGETWNVVALPMVSAVDGKSVVQSYLTNAASAEQPSGEQWLDIGTSATPSWSTVTWSGDRLTTGKDAQQIAFACLGTH